MSPPFTPARVPADGRFLAILKGHVRELAVIAGFSSKDATALELATEEAFLNILQHAFPNGTPGEFFLEGTVLETELRLTFRDEGMPFDPSLLQAAYPAAAAGSGLGLKHIRYAVDEVYWVNCGRHKVRWSPILGQPCKVEPRKTEGSCPKAKGIVTRPSSRRRWPKRP